MSAAPGGNAARPLGAASIMRVLRTYARVYTSDFETTTASLAATTGEAVGTPFDTNGLRLASVGAILVVAGDAAALEPYRATRATLIVDDLDDAQAALATVGAEIIRGPQTVPTGRNLTARLAPETDIEYVEWSAEQWRRVGDTSSTGE